MLRVADDEPGDVALSEAPSLSTLSETLPELLTPAASLARVEESLAVGPASSANLAVEGAHR